MPLLIFKLKTLIAMFYEDVLKQLTMPSKFDSLLKSIIHIIAKRRQFLYSFSSMVKDFKFDNLNNIF